MSDLPSLTGANRTVAHSADPEPARTRSIGRRIGIIAYSVVAGLTVIALIAAGFVVWTIQRSFPQLDGTVSAAGLEADVSVYRDDLGIPTIVADSTHDLFYAQGYVQAQDRFWEMDFRRHVTSGRLAELFGASQLPTDEFLRTLGWRRVAEQEVQALDATIAARLAIQAPEQGEEQAGTPALQEIARGEWLLPEGGSGINPVKAPAPLPEGGSGINPVKATAPTGAVAGSASGSATGAAAGAASGAAAGAVSMTSVGVQVAKDVARDLAADYIPADKQEKVLYFSLGALAMLLFVVLVRLVQKD